MFTDRPMYYRRDGTPYTDAPGLSATVAWAQDFEIANRRVCRTEFWWGGHLSTVWLGLDHNYSPHGQPLIFETMLFTWEFETDAFDNGDFSEVHPEEGCWRYSTEKEAIAGHSDLVREYRYPWRHLASWAWSWFESWEPQHAKKTNTWSLFEPFLEPHMKTSDLLEKMKKKTIRLETRKP